uniref:F-box/FBD/LRR-repeat protein At3g52680-like isoform X2 n=1 Tax=Fragaria vesca subsp. vesca TaxID=101020 RepID=UPI0005CB45DF|nr:PREDICTED: F-box/FBD/LRR-repeat protein At3g52680-like isoform X2 [Fragaria vesca subsp. vesca]
MTQTFSNPSLSGYHLEVKNSFSNPIPICSCYSSAATVYRNLKPRVCSTYQTLYQMKMGSNSKRSKRCAEDRISGLLDAILCHILSFRSTVEAVKTSVLSHRWENLWASVPTIDVCDYDPKEFDFDSFTMFLDRVLLAHDSLKVHRFRICCTKMVDPLLFDYWVSTAIGCNVVELDLDIYPLGPEHSSLPPQCFELPGSLFMLKSLEKLKLSLKSFVTIKPEPSWFPSLKFLHVSVAYASSHLMENLFTCCPALEELAFEAEPEYDDDSIFNMNICAPKLKRLEISFFLDRHDLEKLEYEHKLFINANAPNLEKFTFYGNLLAIYISNNAKSLNEAKIDCTDLHAVQELDDHLDAADNLHRLFTGILNVTYLSVSAPILGHLELLLHACSSWQPLISFLNASPNLESLVLKKSRDCLCRHDPDELHHEWNPPEYVPVCLSSQLKSICIRGYKGTPDQMKVAEYLLNHGEVLNKVTVQLSSKDTTSKKVKKLCRGLKKLPRGSKTCQIVFPYL